MVAALGRTNHHFGLGGLPPSASLPQIAGRLEFYSETKNS
jgi:hypothetical protein